MFLMALTNLTRKENLNQVSNKTGLSSHVKNKISFDLIDLKSIKPLNISIIRNSLKKTKKLLILDSISHPICSVGSEILSQLYREKNIKLTKQNTNDFNFFIITASNLFNNKNHSHNYYHCQCFFTPLLLIFQLQVLMNRQKRLETLLW